MDKQMTIKALRNEAIGKYLTIQRVAELLCCSERHIYGLIQDGKLTAIKLGSRVFRISEQSFCDFIEAQTVDPEDFFAPEEDKKEIRKELQTAGSKIKRDIQEDLQEGRVARSKWMQK